MDISLDKFRPETDLAILPIFKEESVAALCQQKLKISLPTAVGQDFSAELGSGHIFYGQMAGRILLLGLGPKKSFGPSSWRQALHLAMRSVMSIKLETISLFLPSVPSSATAQYLELSGFGLIYSLYQFEQYKKSKSASVLKKIKIVAPINQKTKRALDSGIAIGTAANAARNLSNHPGNVATPMHLAEHAVRLARHYKFSAKILGPKEIAKEGLGLLMGVAQGSDQPARFIILEYGDKKQDPIVLIGKGLTFDSGGISIKPADRMEEMKFDMAGGAAVLGIFEAAASLKLGVRLVGLIAAAENLVSGSAIKPGDVLTAHDQTHVEVVNTDAEGRLVLADALSFAQKHYHPRLMIDYATLTGAVVMALGDQYAGYFANTKTYDKFFSRAAATTGEQFWPLPLAAEYRDQLKSFTADIKNIGDRGLAGAVVAALFLEYFVRETLPWIHFDIAGTAWTTRPKNYANVGATGWGVYLTIKFLRSL